MILKLMILKFMSFSYESVFQIYLNLLLIEFEVEFCSKGVRRIISSGWQPRTDQVIKINICQGFIN